MNLSNCRNSTHWCLVCRGQTGQSGEPLCKAKLWSVSEELESIADLDEGLELDKLFMESEQDQEAVREENCDMDVGLELDKLFKRGQDQEANSDNKDCDETLGSDTSMERDQDQDQDQGTVKEERFFMENDQDQEAARGIKDYDEALVLNLLFKERKQDHPESIEDEMLLIEQEIDIENDFICD